jgi:hypothetical protein
VLLRQFALWADKHITHKLSQSPEFQRFVHRTNTAVKEQLDKLPKDTNLQRAGQPQPQLSKLLAEILQALRRK